MIYETEVALPKLWGFGLQFILMVEGQLEQCASVHIQVAHHSSAEQQVLHSRSQLRLRGRKSQTVGPGAGAAAGAIHS